jgi:hypothetical protein
VEDDIARLMWYIWRVVGSSGKGLGLCGSLMRSKVRIPLGANNSLGSARRRSWNITQSLWRERFTQN